MDKEQRLAERAQELWEQEEAIAGTASKLQIRPEGLTEDLDGRRGL